MARRKSNSFFIASFIATVLAGAPLASRATSDGTARQAQAERIARLEPQIVAFVERCDLDVLARGRELTDEEALIAEQLGVAHPENVRILVSRTFPEPDDPKFAAAIRKLGPANPLAETTGYGIEMTPGVATSRRILRHELTHVAQFERFGTAGFMHAYLGELTGVGYGGSAFEAEAKANERPSPQPPAPIAIR